MSRCEFERQIPFHMRCRTSLLALPSVYSDPEQARRDSPDVSRRNLKRTLQVSFHHPRQLRDRRCADQVLAIYLGAERC